MANPDYRVALSSRETQVALLVAVTILVGALVAARSLLAALLLGVFVGLAVLAFLIQHHSTATDLVLFLSISIITLSVYAFPLPGGFDLQLNRTPILMAIPLWLLPSVCPPYRRLRLRISPAFFWYGLFVTYVMLSTAFLSENLRSAISQLAALIFRGALFVWLIQIVVRRKQLLLSAKALLVSGLIIIAFAAWQYGAWVTKTGMEGSSFVIPFSDVLGMRENTVGHVARIGSIFRLTLPFGSSSHLAPAIAALLLVAVGIWLHWSKQKKRAALLLLLYCMVMTLLLLGTFSRGAWLGFAAGLLLIVMTERRLLLKRRLWRAALVGLVLAAMVAPLLLPFAGTVLGRFDPALMGPSNEGHTKFLRWAVEMFSSSPIVGIGWANYEARTGVLHAHNMYMTVLAEGGVIGLTLWLAFCLTIVRHGIQAMRASKPGSFLRYWNLGLSAAFLSILVNNLFQTSAYFGLAWLIPGLIIASHYVTNLETREAS